MPRRDLGGGVAVITGGAGGIGLALALRLERGGCRVVLVDIDVDRLAAAASKVPGAMSIVCDVTDVDDCRNAVRLVAEGLGGIDLLVNNAGITHRSAFVDTDPSVIERVMAVNYLGAVNMTSAALPSLAERQGAIVVMSSVAGFAPLLGRTGYAGAKHALVGLFSTLRNEVGSLGIDITVVSPTFVATDMQQRALGADGLLTDHPQSRIGKQVDPGALADIIVAGVERRRRHIVIGGVGKATHVLMALSPRLYDRIMRRSLRSELQRGKPDPPTIP